MVDTEVWVERRITYQFGVNKDQRAVGRDTFENLQRRAESDTMGPVDVVKREQRTVSYSEWETA
jgi:hypothetical protein